MRAQQQAVAQRLRFLPRDEQRILRIARRVVRRKIQRLEVVKVGLNLRAFLDRVAEIAEDANHLVHRLDDGMLRAGGTADTGEGDVETLGGELDSLGICFQLRRWHLDAGVNYLCRNGLVGKQSLLGDLNHPLNRLFKFVDALSDVGLFDPGATFSHRSTSCVKIPFLRAIQRSRNIFQSFSEATAADSCSSADRSSRSALSSAEVEKLASLGTAYPARQFVKINYLDGFALLSHLL